MTDQPNPPPSDAEWRARFMIVNFVRIGGTILVFIGILVWQSDLVRPGGWTGVGLPLALLGLVISFGGSQWLVRKWRTPREP